VNVFTPFRRSQPPALADSDDLVAPQSVARKRESDTKAAERAALVRRHVRRKRGWWVSPLTRRILAVNALAPIILVAGLFYLDRYKHELIANDLDSLQARAVMMAAAVGEGAVIDNGFDTPILSPQLARPMLRRLSQPAHARSRLFLTDGRPIADNRIMTGDATNVVQVEELPPPDTVWSSGAIRIILDYVATFVGGAADRHVPVYRDNLQYRVQDFPEVITALTGSSATTIRQTPDHKLVLFAAVPVQHYQRVMGALLATEVDDDVNQALLSVRLTILQVFAVALAITLAMSFYLAGTIARPIRQLALAAERIRRSHGRRHGLPDLTDRDDEIGDLSAAMRDMTEALYRRMDATEAFAADVAHEIKNPLTSLRSAVETVARVPDGAQQRALLGIVKDDVARLDRLISDISDASRLDAEMSRAEMDRIDVRKMLTAMADVYRYTGDDNAVRFAVQTSDDDFLFFSGIEGRIGQVLRNLITNALSFSPPKGTITLRGRRDGGDVVIEIEDDGPGIPEDKLEDIFDRFYSERPRDEKFGTHSGLGLSISRQIIEAHAGTVTASNRKDGRGGVIGARFTIRLPAERRTQLPVRR
jgi:two-component system sensor histidine kinase ChvG